MQADNCNCIAIALHVLLVCVRQIVCMWQLIVSLLHPCIVGMTVMTVTVMAVCARNACIVFVWGLFFRFQTNTELITPSLHKTHTHNSISLPVNISTTLLFGSRLHNAPLSVIIALPVFSAPPQWAKPCNDQSESLFSFTGTLPLCPHHYFTREPIWTCRLLRLATACHL